MATTILSKVKHIYLYKWDDENTPPASVVIDPSTTSTTRLELLNVIGDSVAVTQDDPSTESIACETRDENIKDVTTLGNYTVTMDSADISYDILEACLGYTKVGTTAAAAPASYKDNYAVLALVFDDVTLLIPKLQMTSKIDLSSLKTGVGKGTISGNGYSANVKVAENDAVDTPAIFLDNGQTVVVKALGATE